MTNNENEKPSYYSILTASVRYDKRLSASEKLFYSEITSLCNKNGYCSASNNYFIKLYETTQPTISKWLTNLKKYNYIYIEYEKDNKRKIYLEKPKITKPISKEKGIELDKVMKYLTSKKMQ